MTQRILFSVIICCLVLTAGTCHYESNGLWNKKSIKGNGVIGEQMRGNMDFNAVSTSGAINVFISNDENAPVTIKGDENLLEYVIAEVKGGTLNLHFKEGLGYSSKKGIQVTIPNNGHINKIEARGSSDVTVEGCLQAEQLNIQCSGSSDFNGDLKASICQLTFSGSSDFKGNVEATDCEISCRGSSDCRITGKARTCKASMSGSSDLKGYDFIVEKFDANASGSSDIQITCNQEMSVRASGSSDINYKGNPVITSMKTSGSSDIRKR